MPRLDDHPMRERAAGWLDLPAASSPEAARCAFLSRLQRTDYLPAENWVACVALLDDSGRLTDQPMLGRAAAQSRRQLLNEQLDAFAGQYWQLPPGARQRRWTELSEVVQESSNTAQYMQHLSVGLAATLDGVNTLEGRTLELAQLIRDIYPMRLPERVARRRAWLTKTAKTPGLWLNSAVRLRERMPGLAALDPKLMDVIATRAEDRYVMPARPLVRPEPVARKQESGNSIQEYGWLFFVVVLIVVRVMAIGSRSDSGSSSSSSTYRSTYNAPDSRYSSPNRYPNTPPVPAVRDSDGNMHYVNPRTGGPLDYDEARRLTNRPPSSDAKKLSDPRQQPPPFPSPNTFQPK